MELIIRRDLIDRNIEHMRRFVTPYYRTFLDRVDALGPNPTTEQLVTALGDPRWTLQTCDECNKEVEKVVQLGEEPNYESNTAYVCQDCLEKALALIKGEK